MVNAVINCCVHAKQLDDATEEVKRLSRELFKLEADYPAE